MAVAMVSVHASPLGPLGEGENGGMNLAIRRVCEQLAHQGITTDVFTRLDRPDLPLEQLIATGSRLMRLPVGPPEPVPKHDLVPLLPQLANRLNEHARSERRRYRLIHAHYWLSGLVAERLAPDWRVPWVQSFHTLAGTKADAGLPADPERARAETVLARGADRIIASSRAEKTDIARWTAIHPDRICVVPLGVDLADYAPRPTAQYRNRLQLDEGKRVIAYAGRLERLKGLDLLLEAFAVLRATGRHDDDVVLVAGGDSHDGTSQSNHPAGEVGRLRALADDLGVAPAVRFLGPLPPVEVADLFSLADVVVVPSRTESFGLVALEALAAGTPVVTGTVGGLRDIVEDGVSGYLVAERTPAAFAAGIAAVLDDRSMAERMSMEGRHRAEHFTWGRAARRLALVYDRVTSSGGDHESPCGEPAPGL